MDGKNLTTAIAFLGIAASFLAIIGIEILKGWSKSARARIFVCVSALFLCSLLWVVIAYSRTPDAPAAVKQTLEQAAINITDSAIFKAKNWTFFGAVPKDFISVGGNSNTSMENLTFVNQPEDMLRASPSGQLMNTTKDFLRIKATNVANRLLYRFDSQGPECQRFNPMRRRSSPR